MKAWYLATAAGMSRSIVMVAALLGVSLQAQQPAPAPRAPAAPFAQEAPRTPKAGSGGPLLAPDPTPAAAAQSASSYLEGVWAEEVKGDGPGAIDAYARRVAAFDAERPRAARTVEQLAEALLQHGRLQEAQAQYLRLAREFSDLPGFAQFAQSRWAELGIPGTNQSIARPIEAMPTQTLINPKVRALLYDELQLVEQQIQLVEEQVKAGQVPSIELLKLQREALQMKQRIAAAEGPELDRSSETTTKATDEAAAVESGRRVERGEKKPKPEAPKPSAGERR